MSKKTVPRRPKGKAAAASSSRASNLFIDVEAFQGFASNYLVQMTTAWTTTELEPFQPDLSFILKKLCKRDSTTRLKAISDIIVYFDQQEFPGEFESFIHIWPKIFVPLSIELDRQIREQVSLLHFMIVEKAQKKLALILKDIIGAWLVLMHDISKPASQKAKQAFNIAFSPDKQKSAINFCQKEILEHIKEFLLYQNKESLCDPRFATKDEIESKYHRVISSNLQVLSYLLVSLDRNERVQYSEDYQKILDEKHFWGFSTSPNPFVRKYFYKLIKTLCQELPDDIESRLDKVGSSFLRNVFGDKDSVCHADMWDAVLVLSKNHSDVWAMASKKKPVMNKFFLFFQEGCYHSAELSYPTLLPLMYSIPEQISGGPVQFLSHFSQHFKAYLSKISKISVGHDVALWSLLECLAHLLNNETVNVSERECENFLLCLDDIIEMMLLPQEHHAISDRLSHIFDSFVNLLSKLERGNNSVLNERIFVKIEKSFVKAILQQLNINGAGKWENTRMQLLVKKLLFRCLQDSFHAKEKSILVIAKAINEILNQFAHLSKAVLGEYYEILKCLIELEGFTQLLEYVEDTLKLNIMESLSCFLKQSTGDNKFIDNFFSLLSSWLEIQVEEKLMLIWDAIIDEFTDFDKESTLIYFDGLLKSLSSHENILMKIEFNSFISEKISSKSSEWMYSSKKCSDAILGIMEVALVMWLKDDKYIFQQNTLEKFIFLIEDTLRTINQSLYCSGMMLSDDMEGVILWKDVLCLLDNLFQSKNFARFHLKNYRFFKGIIILFLDVSFAMERPTPDHPTSLSLFESIQNIQGIFQEFLASYPEDLYDDIVDELSGKISYSLYNENRSIAKTLQFLIFIFSVSKPTKREKQYDLILSSAFPKAEDLNVLSVSSCEGKFLFPRAVTILCSWVANVGFTEILSSLNCFEKEELVHPVIIFLYAANYNLVNDSHFYSLWDSLSDSSHEELLPILFNDAISEVQNSEFGHFSTLLTNLIHKEPIANSGTSNYFQFDIIIHNLIQKAKRVTKAEYPLIEITFANVVKMIVEALPDEERFDISANVCVTLMSSKISDKLFAPATVRLIRGLLLIVTPILEELHSKKLIQLQHHLLIHAINTSERSLENVLLWLTATPFPNYFLEHSDFKSDAFCHIFTFLSKVEKSWSLPFQIEESGLVSVLLGSILREEFFSPDNRTVMKKAGLSSQYFQDFIISHINRVLHLVGMTYALSNGIETSLDKTIACTLSLFLELLSCAERWQPLGKQMRNSLLLESVQSIAINIFLSLASNPNKNHIEGEDLLSQLFTLMPRNLLIPHYSKEKCFTLINSSSLSFQKCVYWWLKQVLYEEAIAMSITIEISTDISSCLEKSRIPNLLLSNLDVDHSKWMENIDSTPETIHEITSFFFSWMTILDYFEEAAFVVRANNLQLLKDNSNLTANCLNVVMWVLNVHEEEQGMKPFDVNLWDITEYEVECAFIDNFQLSLGLLASHLYYRLLVSLPSLVRLWWLDIRNRSLSKAIENYTMAYFSPCVIKKELHSVYSDFEREKKKFDSLTVKTGGNKVVISYSVDENALDITIQLPVNYPLKQAEIDGGQKAGVKESRWRGWLLSTQTVIMTQSGSLSDAIALFYKNVSLHFEGIEDCTICYSIIGMTDRSLPNKQCKTCKKKFHAGCLYKWFRSSGQSTCPLCRTLF